ncbi:hypothetical protein OGAPHI_004509 [Ogataea philodendri]|uniref:Uncharacterized protein n=1 Tax=Ogataea philodendri TaxID=1378263 RepID=A0A9P8T5Q3_9ASCO|nr:uncharacterized protein OGAPHI_004509 [Ogataea philodendri]KAH3666320.1 hypothetical protein OGAPHI_004509 [Ogataea philodendri]
MTKETWIDLEKGKGKTSAKKLNTLNRVLMYVVVGLCCVTFIATVRKYSDKSHCLHGAEVFGQPEQFIVDKNLKAQNYHRRPLYEEQPESVDSSHRASQKSPAILQKEVEEISLVSRLVLIVDSFSKKYQDWADDLWGDPILMDVNKHPYNDNLKDFIIDYFKVDKFPILLLNGRPLVSGDELSESKFPRINRLIKENLD